MNDPLETLYIDKASVDRERIVAALNGKIAIDRKTRQLVVLEEFEYLPTKKQVITFLLGTKAAVLLGALASDEVSPSGIADATGMVAGTVRRLVGELTRERIVTHHATGRYSIPDHAVAKAIKALDG